MKRFMSMEGLGPALRSVILRVKDAASKRPSDLPNIDPRLVAVSKLKPAECIVESYEHGQRHFGENYVQELLEKSNHPKIQELKDIRWHFIGHLQSNKCNNLVGELYCQGWGTSQYFARVAVYTVPNLFMVETVHSEKLASTLNASWGKQYRHTPLSVMVQVNTSEEESKNGCSKDHCVQLVAFIIQQCPHLKFAGLMTIGEMNYDWNKGPNPDFICLAQCRRDVCHRLGLSIENVELSMGMSSDFDKAILMGSTNVRVGSTIFGARQPKRPSETENMDIETTLRVEQDDSAREKAQKVHMKSVDDSNLLSTI